jgi:hypothetical protein
MNTPETDQNIVEIGFDVNDNPCQFVTAEFARRLERERDEAKELAQAFHNDQVTLLLERDEAREALENYKASTIHSCNEECKRPMCVLRRQRREAREDAEHWKTEYLIVAARLCGKKHPRDNGIISEHEIIPKLERERDNWEQTAADYLEGMHYYRGLVQEIGETIGEAACLQDDGGKVDSVLCAKVPELVVDLKRERDEAREDARRLERERDGVREILRKVKFSEAMIALAEAQKNLK